MQACNHDDGGGGGVACSVFEYSKSQILSAERGLSETSIRLCSRTSRFLKPSLW